MIFHKTPLQNVFLIEPEKRGDERGFFARVFCDDEFATHGLETRFVQANNSLTAKKGTLRGMHYQVPPAAESKLFRVIRGAVHDVIIDLRPGSDTYCEWESFVLSAAEPRLLYVPECFAQGFQTLEDHTEITYQVSAAYSPELGRGLRHDDPAFDLDWPLPVEILSEKDRSWPDFVPDRS